VYLKFENSEHADCSKARHTRLLANVHLIKWLLTNSKDTKRCQFQNFVRNFRLGAMNGNVVEVKVLKVSFLFRNGARHVNDERDTTSALSFSPVKTSAGPVASLLSNIDPKGGIIIVTECGHFLRPLWVCARLFRVCELDLNPTLMAAGRRGRWHLKTLPACGREAARKKPKNENFQIGCQGSDAQGSIKALR
jgi:hypothetical protein